MGRQQSGRGHGQLLGLYSHGGSSLPQLSPDSLQLFLLDRKRQKDLTDRHLGDVPSGGAPLKFLRDSCAGLFGDSSLDSGNTPPLTAVFECSLSSFRPPFYWDLMASLGLEFGL